jgi:TrmH family RNA methyltransferase
MNLRVVLVEPLYDGNVGSVARAMKNFGFHELALVKPCKIGDYGLAMASHARDVLQMSCSFASLHEALKGADLVVGTTGKRLDEAQHHLRLHLRVPCFTPAQLASKLQGKEGTVALLFGREDCGLNSEELMLCDLLVSIPTKNEYHVMNLSHSAALLFYELSQLDDAEGNRVEMAHGESLSLLQDRTRLLLSEVSYPPHKVDFTLLMLRRILGRAELTEREARTLLGLTKRIRWKIADRGLPEMQNEYEKQN